MSDVRCIYLHLFTNYLLVDANFSTIYACQAAKMKNARTAQARCVGSLPSEGAGLHLQQKIEKKHAEVLRIFGPTITTI